MVWVPSGREDIWTNDSIAEQASSDKVRVMEYSNSDSRHCLRFMMIGSRSLGSLVLCRIDTGYQDGKKTGEKEETLILLTKKPLVILIHARRSHNYDLQTWQLSSGL